MTPKTSTRPNHPVSVTEARLIVAASETDANLLYATRFFAPDPFIFFIHDRRDYVVVSDLEIDRARQQARVHSVLSLSGYEQKLRKSGSRDPDTAAVLTRIFKDKGIRSVQVPENFPLGLAAQLQESALRIRPCSGPFFPQRELKTSEEINEIRRVQRTAEAGVEAALQALRECRIGRDGTLTWNGTKLTAEHLKHRIGLAALEQDCVASHTIVACGGQGVDPHQEGHGLLKANQPIIIDVFPRSQVSGYWGDITRTLVKGRASERLKIQFQAVLKAQQLALKTIRPGVTGCQVHQKVIDWFKNCGFTSGHLRGRMQGFFHGTGHGVGLEIHEAPRLSAKGGAPLRPGQVVTVEPGLYYSGVGGVRIEDLVVITQTGFRNLTHLPKFLEIE